MVLKWKKILHTKSDTTSMWNQNYRSVQVSKLALYYASHTVYSLPLMGSCFFFFLASRHSPSAPDAMIMSFLTASVIMVISRLIGRSLGCTWNVVQTWQYSVYGLKILNFKYCWGIRHIYSLSWVTASSSTWNTQMQTDHT